METGLEKHHMTINHRLFPCSESQEAESKPWSPPVKHKILVGYKIDKTSRFQCIRCTKMTLTCKQCRRSRRGGRSCPGRWPLLPPQSPRSHCSECRACVGSPAYTDTHHSSWKIPPGQGRSHKLKRVQEWLVFFKRHLNTCDISCCFSKWFMTVMLPDFVSEKHLIGKRNLLCRSYFE